jgi:hypothetical protein
MKRHPRFSQASIDFIDQASRQKKKEWLEHNRDEYELVLVEPMREVMHKVERALRNEATGYLFPKRNFARILRGAEGAMRHGPFRDWVGVGVSRKAKSRFEKPPSLYFHISENEGCFTAGGLYMSSADQTKHIRCWIHQDPTLLEELLEDRAFKKLYKEGLGREQVLKTKPRDYSLDHPRIEWLKLSAFYVYREIKKKELFSADFADILIEDWRQILRLNQILDRYTQNWPKTQVDHPVRQARPFLDDWDDE